MLQHVFERASQARYLTSIIIATDDKRIEDAARAFRSPGAHDARGSPSGTDRVAEVASAETAELIVNIQGDEPLIDPAAIDAAILPLGTSRMSRWAPSRSASRIPAKSAIPTW
jgi:3-deoxy-manno-octulosonate cytidylyltransferase (CMP-KDO synthetase)